jgi:hypothetical protein
MRKLGAAHTHGNFSNFPPPRGETLNRLHISFRYIPLLILLIEHYIPTEFQDIFSARFNITGLGVTGPGIRSIINTDLEYV